MSFFSFFSLIYQIFVAKIPNISKIRAHGLLATKIGQLYALRADFIGLERSKILTELYEKNFDKNQITVSTDKYFSKDFQAHFSLIASEPFSEASIGKVYAANLLD